MATDIEQQSVTPDQEDKLKIRTTKISVIEGTVANISLNFGDNFLIPFTLALGASNAQVGILSSLIGIINPSMQIVGAHWMESAPRKKLLVRWVLFQASMFPILFLLAYLFYQQIWVQYLPNLAIVIILFYYAGGNIPSPVWFSLMGDVVPQDRRGRYFAMRNIITNIISTTMLIVMSLLLDSKNAQGDVIIGFMWIFGIGLCCRCGSGFACSKHYFPKYVMKHDKSVSFSQFLKDLPQTNFGRFCLLAALITFGQYIANPFFSVYMLEDLHFPYATYIIINASQTLLAFLFYPIFGRFSDKYGNVKTFKIGAIIVPFLPLLWLFISDPIGLVLGPQLGGAIGWTAFNLAASNFIYDCFPPEKRGYYSAYYNFLLGVGMVAGGLTGTAIISFFNITFMNPLQFLFLLSGIARIMVIIILLPTIKEIRTLCAK